MFMRKVPGAADAAALLQSSSCRAYKYILIAACFWAGVCGYGLFSSKWILYNIKCIKCLWEILVPRRRVDSGYDCFAMFSFLNLKVEYYYFFFTMRYMCVYTKPGSAWWVVFYLRCVFFFTGNVFLNNIFLFRCHNIYI